MSDISHYSLSCTLLKELRVIISFMPEYISFLYTTNQQVEITFFVFFFAGTGNIIGAEDCTYIGIKAVLSRSIPIPQPIAVSLK